MCEQLFLFGITQKEEKPPQEERQKEHFALLYDLMRELYKMTITKPLKDVKYYIEDDTSYAEINGTQYTPLKKRIKIYQELIEQLKNKKQFPINTENKIIVNYKE